MTSKLIKTDEEIEIMREGGRILSQIVKEIKTQIKAGQKTKEIEKIAQKLFKKYHVKSSFLGHNGYPAHLCVSLNEEIVHGIPSERKIKDGDLVSIDMGIKYQGLNTDTALTVGIGNISKKDKKLIRITRESLAAGIKQARLGNRIGDISFAIQKKVERAGFSVIRDCTGHGIGRELHEKPTIPNFGSQNTGPQLMAGMTLAIEPMVATGGFETKVLADGWTIATRDNSRTAHFEDTILITPNGPEFLTNSQGRIR